jgi:methylglyoxal synthase
MNKRDIVTRAFQALRVVGVEDAPEAHQTELGLEIYEQVLADLNGVYGCTLPFTVDQDIPAAYQTGLITLTAVRLASPFNATAPEPEISAMMRVRAVNKPYVRDMDLNDDDVTEECEIDAVDRSTWY